ncbi:MAG: type II toxin-antitoxin system Phd/YefM family antitoxin [Deltaproteobacteria bacterium]|nr:type II toxin-antitoxin system Phd/YefM family antitoxin [Deltaproteobacteria bacterium]
MRSLRLNEDVVPAKDFKARLSAWLAHVSKTRRPLLITLNGKPAGVLIDPRDFDEAQERARFHEAVRQGMDDAEAGRFVTDRELDALLDAAIEKGRR